MSPTEGACVRRSISGWGLYPSAETDLYRPKHSSAIDAILGMQTQVIARGCGRSYGDAAINARGATVSTERLDRVLSFDPETGVLRCDAGVTILDILARFVPRGFFPPVSPGTQFVTVGGAVACDVHGKNHHRDGSFSRHVRSMLLLLADGSRVECSPTIEPEIFWATMGGMGLTGVILEVELALKRIETAWNAVDYEPSTSLDDTLARFDADDDKYLYSVAWFDCHATGEHFGRGLLMRAVPMNAQDLSARDGGALAWPSSRPWTVPFAAPSWLLGRPMIRAFNAVYRRIRGHRRLGIPVHSSRYLYPLDGLGHWNRLYGSRGFLQYQFVVPYASGAEVIRHVVSRLQRAGEEPFLSVLKRLGACDGRSMLSFPQPGYTLALDLPRRGPAQLELLDDLDKDIVAGGGRIYLAKDARMRPAAFRAMYPEFTQWMTIKERIDPSWRFTSDLARRLGMTA